MYKIQPDNWIYNKVTESIFILGVPFICLLFIGVLPQSLIHSEEFPDYAWLILVVFVDVGHVYSTVYRTYTDKALVLQHKNLFFGLPVLLLVLSVLLHSINPLWFWRALAYLAVFHFIRQQYGIMKIYSRRNSYSALKRRIDVFTIYGVTVIPVLYWHFNSDLSFHWFIKNDFVLLGNRPAIQVVLQVAFVLLLCVYLVSEIKQALSGKAFNLQKNAIVLGTAISWYAGIMYYNSDFIFTFLNVVCHGIPYIALVWMYGKKSGSLEHQRFFKLIYTQFGILIFLLPILLLAYFEENLWDTLVWQEHGRLFLFSSQISVSRSALNIIVPLLALPQLFHYVIDGYIWKMRNDRFKWTSILS